MWQRWLHFALSGATAILNATVAKPYPYICGALMTLVAVFGLSRAAAGGFSETLSEVFSTIVHTAVWGVNKIIEALNWLILRLTALAIKWSNSLAEHLLQFNK